MSNKDIVTITCYGKILAELIDNYKVCSDE